MAELGRGPLALCPRAVGNVHIGLMPGVRSVPCSGCGERVWTAASDREAIAAGAVPVCEACLPDGAGPVCMTPAQVRELAAFRAARRDN